jgi:hypothetical protein
LNLLFFQPHLQRTKLCDMEDQELDPLYVKKRDQLKEVVASMIKPKIVQGRTLNGTEFVSFLGQVILLGESSLLVPTSILICHRKTLSKIISLCLDS